MNHAKRPIRYSALAAVLLAVLLIASCRWRPQLADAPKAAGHGMVASAHPLAGRAGVQMLQNGGNAVDAAVAAAFALSVVEPYSSGLGGGGFMLICPGPGSSVQVLDYRETAPAAASRDMYVKNNEPVPGLSTRGPLAIAVPGTVAGLCTALDRFGSMSLAEVMGPAIGLAMDGFIVDRAFYERSLISLDLLRESPGAAEIFLDHGLPYRPGEKIRQPDLARTLELIAQKGPEVFYHGEIGRTMTEDLAKQGAIITMDDLEGFRVRFRKPVRGTYRGCEIFSMPPPSSGGAVVIETLNILEGYDLAESGYGTAKTAHLMAEAMRRAFADRAMFMGDPAFVDVPLEKLLDKDYARALRQGIDLDRATPSKEVTPGAGIIPLPDDALAAAFPYEGAHTTHLSVVDASGGAVSLTQTINTVFGSGVVARGTGIVMNNEMDDFAALPGKPNAYGLIQGEANAIAPGKIPLSSMSPTMVFKDGELFMVTGSPGGPRIITTVIQTIIAVIDFNMDVQAAVTAPRIHHQWIPDQVYAEQGALSLADRAGLERRGHRVKNYLLPCNAQAVMVMQDGSLEGGSDPRGVGESEGY